MSNEVMVGTIIGAIVLGVLAFIGWLTRHKYQQLEKLGERVTVLETKIDVLGDINETLHLLRTDIEVIKVKIERHYAKEEEGWRKKGG